MRHLAAGDPAQEKLPASNCMPSNASLQHSGMLPSSVTSQPILPAGPSGPHGKPGPPGEQGQMHERLEQPMDQVGSHSPDGHEAMTTESLLKETEDGTEDETDEGVVDEQGIMRIKPSAVEESVQGQDKPWPATRTMSPFRDQGPRPG